MPQDKPDFDDVSGTCLFNSERSRAGYHLNMFCMSLLKPENREAFLARRRFVPGQISEVMKA
jgi:protocatechuate 4,5-dioxygenase alpha chain